MYLSVITTKLSLLTFNAHRCSRNLSTHSIDAESSSFTRLYISVAIYMSYFYNSTLTSVSYEDLNEASYQQAYRNNVKKVILHIAFHNPLDAFLSLGPPNRQRSTDPFQGSERHNGNKTGYARK